MKLVLSGFAGVGKSSILDVAQENYKGLFVFPESAREVNYTKDFYILKDDINNEFFQKSVMDNEIMKVMISFKNKLNNVLYDRCIIDNFSFAEIFYGIDRVDYVKFQDFVNEMCDRYETDVLYDNILFIHATKNEDFIINNVLNDQFRKDTTSHDVKEFIKKSKEWEKIYINILDKIKGVSDNIIFVDHFTENSDYDEIITNILDKSFKN